MRKKIKVKVRYTGRHKLPTYNTKEGESNNNSGMDIYANIDEGSITINPFQIVLIPTGIFCNLPEGYEFQVRSRSGLATRGIIVTNQPGSIDKSYVNREIKVIMINLSSKPFTVSDGYRIAQLVLAESPECIWDETWNPEDDEIDRTDGFGHSGL